MCVEEIKRMRKTESDINTGVRLEPPSGDADLVARGQALARAIKGQLATLESTTLDDTMRSLRGRSWLS